MTEHNQPHPSTSDDQPDEQCHAIIEESDSQPDLCTIYSTALGGSVVTTWISAEAGAFDSLEGRR